METFSTPMMKQYKEIKEKYLDCLLLFRMGDFYELFLEDANIGAKILNITLTSKPIGNNTRIPMAGVPYHAVDAYINKLVKAGFKVAICEQLSPPNKKGLVERDVIRIVTPGTQLSEHALDQKQNNYIICLDLNDQNFSIAIADVSTSYFAVVEKQTENLEQSLKEELAKIKAIECILSPKNYANFELLRILKGENNLNIYEFKNYDDYSASAQKILKDQFNVSTLAGFSLNDRPLSQQTAASLLSYLKETQKSNLSHFKKITVLESDEFLTLDRSTMINLELFSTIREHDTKGSLLNVLDNTQTAMGGRLLKEWLKTPLRDKERLELRYDAITELINSNQQDNYFELLKQIPDIERILSRLSVGLGNARDLINLKHALINSLELKNYLTDNKSTLLKSLAKQIPSELQQTIDLVESSITDEPPIDLRIGGIFKAGINDTVDELRQIVNNSKNWIKELEISERERSGIGSLKVRFNKVFGFYIEVSKANAQNVPDNYLRKQTLVNGERFITKELKAKEELILTAQEKLCDLEYKLFLDLVEKIVSKIVEIQTAAETIAVFDCILNFAYLAQKNQYVRPKLLYSGEIKIKNGRHPVVEKLIEQDSQFVPNDLELDNIHSQLLLITGPNMAGKSVYIRQVALIVLMAQIGSFVPADSAQISVVDRIFVRSGASDVITSGLSTFMVEMVETAYILNHATSNSLIIMDEIGRGTSTYDGISIAWAIAEYLVTNFKQTPKTLFATHYHELQQLETEFPNQIKNYSMAVARDQDTPIFLYKVVEGAASHSYGVAVAKLAGVPEAVIKTAEKKLRNLESIPNLSIPTNPPNPSLIFDDQSIFEHLLYKELDTLDIAQMTPLEALNKLANLKEKIKLISNSNDSFLEETNSSIVNKITD